MQKRRKFLIFGLPFLIILLGIGGLAVMVSSRPVPQKEEQPQMGALVRVMELVQENRQTMVHGTGTVQAGQEAAIAPQVSGRVAEMAPGLAAGGFFRKGELLFAIEEVDYRLAVERAEAAVAKARYELAKEESNAKVARQEWERLGSGQEDEPNPLVLFEPQLANAKAEQRAAEAALQQARVELERTKVKAPFDCIIRVESIDLGQYVRAGNTVATVSGTDQVEIVVPLPLEDLAWLSVPQPGRQEPGSAVKVRQAVGARTYDWQGRIVRSLGHIDEASRMAQVVVAVEDPYGISQPLPDARPPLAVGMFVDVALEGRPLAEVVVIPRRALRDNSTIWVMDRDLKLRIRPVQVQRLEQEEALISSDFAPGEQLVLTNLSGAAEGLELRPFTEETNS